MADKNVYVVSVNVVYSDNTKVIHKLVEARDKIGAGREGLAQVIDSTVIFNVEDFDNEKAAIVYVLFNLKSVMRID